MTTLKSTATFKLPSWLQTRSLSALLPTNCILCNAWQSQAVCLTCQSRWRDHAPRCLRCAIRLPRQAQDQVCQACEDQSPEFDRAIAALDYEAPWKSAVSRLKFREAIAIAQPLAGLMHEAICTRPHPVDMILPVPLSSNRLRERGFNQAWLLAQHLSISLQRPARHDVLQRTRHTHRLMSLDAEDRRAHIRDAFEVSEHKRSDIRHRHIAIVDDVLTTGATLNEVALTLFEAGARSVSAWVLARTPAPDRPKGAPLQTSSGPELVHSLSRR